MAAPSAGTKIVLQVGEELRIRNNGDIVVDNPELELEGKTAQQTLCFYTDSTRNPASMSCVCWIPWPTTSMSKCTGPTIKTGLARPVLQT